MRRKIISTIIRALFIWGFVSWLLPVVIYAASVDPAGASAQLLQAWAWKACFAISEVLSFIPWIKANGVFQLIFSGLARINAVIQPNETVKPMSRTEMMEAIDEVVKTYLLPKSPSTVSAGSDAQPAAPAPGGTPNPAAGK